MTSVHMWRFTQDQNQPYFVWLGVGGATAEVVFSRLQVLIHFEHDSLSVAKPLFDAQRNEEPSPPNPQKSDLGGAA